MSYMKSRDDLFGNDYVHLLEQNSIAYKKLTDAFKLIYIINKKIHPALIRHDFSYQMYNKICAATIYASYQLSKKPLYFIECRLPGFTTTNRNKAIEIAAWGSHIRKYTTIPNNWSNLQDQDPDENAIQEGDIKVYVNLIPYLFGSESGHIYLDCILYVELNSTPINNYILHNKRFFIDITAMRSSENLPPEHKRLYDFFDKTFAKYIRCKVYAYVKNGQDSVKFRFVDLNLLDQNKKFICKDITNNQDRRTDWMRFVNDKYPENLFLYCYTHLGKVVET